jgi:hypothetical protein
MTAVNWLEIEIKNEDHHTEGELGNSCIDVNTLLMLVEQAKEMHRAEHGKTWDKAIESHENRGHNIERSWCDFDEYYKETFGSNVSSDVELPQPKISDEEKNDEYLLKCLTIFSKKLLESEKSKNDEISDEEIEKASYKFWEFKEHTQSTCWKMGAKWYKEQLKKRQ